MPDTITHYLFGLETTKKIATLPLYKMIKNHRHLFFIGCQGPDPMYYHKPIKNHNYAFVARKMHTEQTGYFLSSALCYAKRYKEEPTIFEPLMSYISGLLCHYALDLTTHPYIFYLSGHYLKNDPSTEKYKGTHKRIELALDTLLLQELYGTKAHHFKVNKHILKNVEFPEELIQMYDELLFSIYAIPYGGSIFKESYKDFRQYYALTHDRIGLKRNIAETLSFVLPTTIKDYAESFSYYHCLEEGRDYFNEAKKVWLHPVTGNVHTQSFRDLMRNAHKLSYSLLEASHHFLDSALTLNELESLLPNLSYTTGLPTTDTRPMRYFSY